MSEEGLLDTLHQLLRADDLRARHLDVFARAAQVRAARSGAAPTQTRIARRRTADLARVVAALRRRGG